MTTTIKEVARAARVSVGTVSNVLQGNLSVRPELRARVERTIRELNYHPSHAARSLKARRTGTLAMVVSDIANPFFPLVVRGAEDAALKRGYMLTVFNTDDHVEREQQIFALLRTGRADGVLAVVSPHSASASHLRDTLSAGLPLVCLDRMPPGDAVDAVVVDNVKGAMFCTRHLIAMGHREIGMIGGQPTLQTAQDRLKGYRLALEEAGIPYQARLVREGDFRLESGYRMAKQLLLDHPRPTALFVANGTMGLGALKAIDEMAMRCPDDVALAVFDDVPGADIFRPRLTVVSQPAYEIGRRAAELLIERLNGELESDEPVVIVLEPELKIQESTVGQNRQGPV